MFSSKHFLMFPNTDINPGFTNPVPGEAQETPGEEAQILGDQDATAQFDNLTRDENMGAPSYALEPLEDEPSDFMRGEVDVKEQMDRAADAMDISIHGYESQAYEDSPRGDLGASFRDTPGGLEEVIEKTDQDLATGHPYREEETKRSPDSRKH